MGVLTEQYKTCGRCVHSEEDADIVDSICYLCRRNPSDHRRDYFEEISALKECMNDKQNTNSSTLKECEYCNGSIVKSFEVRAKNEMLVHNLARDLDRKLLDLQNDGYRIISVMSTPVIEYDYPKNFNSTLFTIVAERKAIL